MYKKLRRLGEGTYGTVYLAKDRRSGETVAMKRLLLTNELLGFHLTSLREVALLRRLEHRNIVALRDVVVGRQPNQVFIVFELCEYDLGTLLDRTARHFTVSEVKTLVLQMLRGLEYLHDMGIIHRDIKLSNLLVSPLGDLKIADFGLARVLPTPLAPLSPSVYTLWYRAPELLLNAGGYHTAADMWAAGCVMGELLLHHPLFPGGNTTEQVLRIAGLLGPPTVAAWPACAPLLTSPAAVAATAAAAAPGAPSPPALAAAFPALSGSEAGVDLLGRMLCYDPARRITAAQAVRHPWFAEAPAPCPPHKMPVFKSRQQAAATATAAAAAAAATAAAAAAAAAPSAAAAVVAGQTAQGGAVAKGAVGGGV